MKKLLASLLCAVMAIGLAPISLDAAARQNVGQIAGHATKDGKPLSNYKVQLRNVDTKQLVGSMQSDAAGAFNFTGLPAGNFVVETIDAAGNIVATSTVIGLTAGAMIAANVGVGTSAALAGAGAGAAAAGAGAAGAAGGGLGATTLLITGGAILAGTGLAVVAVKNNASPSGS
ncbi:MAG: carboxypeptidase-like regulatory domain-containing protein [Vicinamibacterales bacterium]